VGAVRVARRDGSGGDVALVSHVTYFVRTSSPSSRALRAAPPPGAHPAEQRPPPSTWAPFSPSSSGGARSPAGAAGLAARSLGAGHPARSPHPPLVNTQTGAAATPEEAVTPGAPGAGHLDWRRPDGRPAAAGAIEEHFDALIERTEQGFQGHWAATAPAVLITWPTEEPA
jgi:hypothetical protein